MTTPLIVTGCPRSGTTTMAHVLGILHEQQFDVLKAAHTASDMSLMLQSECAWQATPFAAALLQRGIRVLHLVRNPLDTVASMVARGMFVRDDHVSDLFIRRYVPVPEDGTQLEKCVAVWIGWNERLLSLEVPRIRIEDVAGAPRLHEGPPTKALTWTDFADTDVTRQAREIGRQCGYE